MSGIVLRHHFEALRVSHHVPKDTTRHEIRFFRSLTAFREFHLHLPRIVAIHEPAKFREGHELRQATLHRHHHGRCRLHRLCRRLSLV